MMFLSAVSIAGGRNSWLRTIAIDNPKNVPIIRPSTELYSVPQIAGSRPNSWRFVSQVLDVMRSGPNFATAGAAVHAIFRTMYVTRATTLHANAWVTPRTARSAARSLAVGGRAMAPGPASSSSVG